MAKKPNYIDNYFQIVLWILGVFALKYVFDLKINGRKNIQIKKPLVIIANHRSKLDPFLILSAMGWRNFFRFYPGRYPLTKALAEKWWLMLPSWLAGCYKIEPRGDIEKSLRETFRAIDGGYSMIFFPEGKMVKAGEKPEIKRGIGHVAAKRDIHILPVGIGHSGHTRRQKLGKVSRATISFGEMIESRILRESCLAEELHEALMKKVYELKEKSEAFDAVRPNLAPINVTVDET